MNKKRTFSIFNILTVYSLGHFYIDFLSAFAIAYVAFSNSSNLVSVMTLVIFYNILAFGLQPFFGFYLDLKKKPRLISILGLIFSTIGFSLFMIPWVAAILLGIGNALYHVGGGFVALNLKPGKAKFPGIYVAPGAIGLFVGGILGYKELSPYLFIPLTILITIILTFFIIKVSLPKFKKFKDKKFNLVPIILLLLLISVSSRALIGYSLQLEWKSLLVLSSILILAIASGKFFGGFIADKYGFMKTGIIGLLIATPLLVFFQSIPILVFVGAFAFNVVMPITLTALAESLPNYKAFAFGLTTLSLISGYLSFFLFKDYIIYMELFTAIVLLINIITLYVGLKKFNEMKL